MKKNAEKRYLLAGMCIHYMIFPSFRIVLKEDFIIIITPQRNSSEKKYIFWTISQFEHVILARGTCRGFIISKIFVI